MQNHCNQPLYPGTTRPQNISITRIKKRNDAKPKHTIRKTLNSSMLKLNRPVKQMP
jgi:hypothetical protein